MDFRSDAENKPVTGNKIKTWSVTTIVSFFFFFFFFFLTFDFWTQSGEPNLQAWSTIRGGKSSGRTRPLALLAFSCIYTKWRHNKFSYRFSFRFRLRSQLNSVVSTVCMFLHSQESWFSGIRAAFSNRFIVLLSSVLCAPRTISALTLFYIYIYLQHYLYLFSYITLLNLI